MDTGNGLSNMPSTPMQDLLKQVKKLEIQSRKLSNSVTGGNFMSAFKGRGMSFKEVREYVAGDDPRFIDWNTSARLGDTYTKVFDEDKDFRFMLLVDGSASAFVGSGYAAKMEYATQLAASIGFSSMSNNEKTGLLIFTDQVEQYIPPEQGKDHFLRILTKLLTYRPKKRGTDLAKALQLMVNTTRQTTIFFVISDFVSPDFTKQMKMLAPRHDCIAMHVYDALDMSLPDIGLLPIEDAETGELVWMDSSNPATRHAMYQKQQQQILEIQQSIVNCGWDYIRLRTDMAYANAMQTFLRNRIKNKRSR